MPRIARTLIDGGTYHVLTRGNNAQPVFHDAADFQRYLQLLSSYSLEHGLKIYHFVLMPNHVHLVMEVPRAAMLSTAMSGLNLRYALYYRKRYGYRGHLWQDRFKSLVIDQDSYLLECGRYVELNPVRAGLVREPREYRWSSYRFYTEGASHPFLSPHPLYETLGASTGDRQRRYIQFVQDRLSHWRAQHRQSFGQHRKPISNPFGDIDSHFSFGARRKRRRSQGVGLAGRGNRPVPLLARRAQE